MSYRWTKPKAGGPLKSWANELLFFHDFLLDGHLVAWVREDRRYEPPVFMPQLNNPTDHHTVLPAGRSLAEAKAQVIHYFVTQRMEDAQ